MKLPNDVHFRRADPTHYKAKLSCGVVCATGLSVMGYAMDHAVAGAASIIVNLITTIFWIWE